jgi:transcriptional regulator with XRE-family HTH domain
MGQDIGFGRRGVPYGGKGHGRRFDGGGNRVRPGSTPTGFPPAHQRQRRVVRGGGRRQSKGKSIKEIARNLKISRNTVRKRLRVGNRPLSRLAWTPRLRADYAGRGVLPVRKLTSRVGLSILRGSWKEESPMRWISASQLEQWAPSNSAREALPKIVSDLILASSPDISAIRFASGDKGQVRGFDGVLDSAAQGLNVAEGRSYWEIGTDKDYKDKAKRDFEKRTREVSESQQADTTLVLGCVDEFDQA